MFEVIPHIALFLIFAALVAGFVDAIAGGGGLITVPALLLAGASPIEALATNKLQGSFGSGTAMLTYARAGQVRLQDQLWMSVISAVAAAVGALVAHLLPIQVLRIVMPLVLVAVALFFAFKPGLTDADSAQRISKGVFTVTFVPLIAAYDGLLGPGTGSFFMLGFVMLAGFGMLRATAHTKTLNFASNIGSFAVFAWSGAVWWGIGLAMGVAQMAGAALGARLAMRIGSGLIKPLIVITSTAMAARLLWQIWA